MALLDADSRQRLFTYLHDAFDDDNAGDMDAFALNFLHNAKVWDALADAFPTASASAVRTVMMEAYAAWRKEHGAEPPAPR